MIDRKQYNRLLDTLDDPEYIAKRVIGSMSKEEFQANFGADANPRGPLPPPGHVPIHWRKNPGYDSAGQLVCPGCGHAMTVAQSERDGHTHAVCVTGGCELYGRDYVAGSEQQNPHKHYAARFDETRGKYFCQCGQEL